VDVSAVATTTYTRKNENLLWQSDLNDRMTSYLLKSDAMFKCHTQKKTLEVFSKWKLYFACQLGIFGLTTFEKLDSLAEKQL